MLTYAFGKGGVNSARQRWEFTFAFGEPGKIVGIRISCPRCGSIMPIDGPVPADGCVEKEHSCRRCRWHGYPRLEGYA